MTDPAGLDAAMEASLIAYDHALNDLLGNPPGSVMGSHGRAQLGESVAWRAAITAAVRAALLEAADEIEAANCYGESGVVAWLRERAGRIGGGV